MKYIIRYHWEHIPVVQSFCELVKETFDYSVDGIECVTEVRTDATDSYVYLHNMICQESILSYTVSR